MRVSDRSARLEYENALIYQAAEERPDKLDSRVQHAW